MAGELTLVDNHSHVILSDFEKMVASAKAHKLVECSITEHVSQFKELRDKVRFGSVHSKGRLFASLEEYLDGFALVKDEGGLRVGRGLEVDYSPRFEEMVGDFVKQEEWDVLLCSVHEFENGRDVETGVRGLTDRLTVYAKWYDYFRLQQMLLESDFVPFNVLSHPVRMSRATSVVPPEMDELLLDLASTAKRRGKALELNGSDVDYNKGLVRRLAVACSKVGCGVSLGSDSHHPSEVFHNVPFALELVKELGLDVYRAKRV